MEDKYLILINNFKKKTEKLIEILENEISL